MNLYWKFLQDWHNEFEEKFLESGIVAHRCQNGWMVAHYMDTENGNKLVPLSWYELPDAEATELFK